MELKYVGLSEINGPLVVLDNVKDVAFDEIAQIRLSDGTRRLARVVEVEQQRAVLQVFEGTKGLSLTNTTTRFSGKPMELGLSKEMLGRIFSGSGRPIDGLGDIIPEKFKDINGSPLNPVSRTYPRNYINTGISSIDALMTLIRGQKLPIFSGSGLSHNKLAVQIARQAKIADDNGQGFGIVFGAMGVKNDVADYFKRSFEETGALERVAMFINLSNDPIIERILTPRCALTCAEYLAFEHNMHILVILTDMTSYAEACREFSSSKGEIPGRKGYPGYLYSDLASIYERAGIVKGSTGSVTQIPILTMPNDDITHPVPFAAYSKVQDARALASVIGEEELSQGDKAYMHFGKLFEEHFINQGFDVNRSIEETLDLGWALLSTLPRAELDRVDDEHLDKYYDPDKAKAMFQ